MCILDSKAGSQGKKIQAVARSEKRKYISSLSSCHHLPHDELPGKKEREVFFGGEK